VIRQLTAQPLGQGLYECTDAVQAAVRDAGVPRDSLHRLYPAHPGESGYLLNRDVRMPRAQGCAGAARRMPIHPHGAIWSAGSHLSFRNVTP